MIEFVKDPKKVREDFLKKLDGYTDNELLKEIVANLAHVSLMPTDAEKEDLLNKIETLKTQMKDEDDTEILGDLTTLEGFLGKESLGIIEIVEPTASQKLNVFIFLKKNTCKKLFTNRMSLSSSPNKSTFVNNGVP